MSQSLQLPDGASLVTGPGGFPQLRVVTAACSGQLTSYGAHVTGWSPAGTKPVLWTSSAAHYERGTAIRGGIPICAPWFGPGLSGDRTPAHGWMRTAMWELMSVVAEGEDIVATLLLDGRSIEGGGPLRARYDVRFGTTLRTQLSLTVDEPQVVETALHTYLAVGDVRRITLTGLEDAAFLVRGEQAMTPAEGRALRFTGEVDRSYASTSPVRVADPDLQRVITVTKENSATTVVWNPGAEKSATLKDVPVGGWTGFVCVETANAGDAAVSLAAGQTLSMATQIAVEQGPDAR